MLKLGYLYKSSSLAIYICWSVFARLSYH